jgi:glycosyltransferase involved in cell wall biosynthesis
VTPSRATADEIIRRTRTDAAKIFLIPLAARPVFAPRPADAIELACANAGLAKGQYLLVPGTIEPRKNGVRVVQAFERAIRERRLGPDVQLAFAGGLGWKSDGVIHAVQRSSVHTRIRMLGYVTDDALAALMTGAAGVVYASLAEGFGLPVLEAMACGAPVVTSNRSSMPEVAGDAAHLVDPTDISELAAAMGELSTMSTSARRSTGDAGRARAAEFSWTRTAAETVHVYETVA